MTDESAPSSRKIVGLEPRRQPDLSRLVKGNRAAAAPAPLALVLAAEPAGAEREAANVEPADAAPEAATAAAPRAARAPKPAAKPAAPAPDARAAADSPKRSTSIYLTDAVRSRGTAAFMATQYLEGDTSWSDFIETAILREAERREKTHNAGKPFVLAHRLSAGRPARG